MDTKTVKEHVDDLIKDEKSPKLIEYYKEALFGLKELADNEVTLKDCHRYLMTVMGCAAENMANELYPQGKVNNSSSSG
jgi:hypothetical protein